MWSDEWAKDLSSSTKAKKLRITEEPEAALGVRDKAPSQANHYPPMWARSTPEPETRGCELRPGSRGQSSPPRTVRERQRPRSTNAGVASARRSEKHDGEFRKTRGSRTTWCARHRRKTRAAR